MHVIELYFNMAMIKDWIKLYSNEIWRLEHEVAHAMVHIKLVCFLSVFTDMTDRIQKWKGMHYLIKMVLS